MTLVVHGDDAVLEQVTKQLNKLVDVISIPGLPRPRVRGPRTGAHAREGQRRHALGSHADLRYFRAKIVDVQHKNFLIEVSGNEGKINKFIRLMQGFGISDLKRTGKVAMSRQEEG